MPYTTRGLYLKNDWAFRRQEPLPDYFYVVLLTSATTPTHAIKTLSELTEIAAGNGYNSGGIQLTAGSLTDFDGLTEDDTDGIVELSLRNISWTASGGSIPATGAAARYVALLVQDDASPQVIANRQVMWYASLGVERTAVAGQTLQLAGLDIRTKGGTMLKSDIQRGAITISNGSTSNTATITAVDMTRTEVHHGGVIAPAQDSSDVNVLLTLTNATTVTAQRGGSDGDVTVRFMVVEHW